MWDNIIVFWRNNDLINIFAYIGKWERGVSYVHLETLKSLDRETTASYLLNISATASEQAQQVNGVYRGTLNF